MKAPCLIDSGTVTYSRDWTSPTGWVKSCSVEKNVTHAREDEVARLPLGKITYIGPPQFDDHGVYRCSCTGALFYADAYGENTFPEGHTNVPLCPSCGSTVRTRAEFNEGVYLSFMERMGTGKHDDDVSNEGGGIL